MWGGQWPDFPCHDPLSRWLRAEPGLRVSRRAWCWLATPRPARPVGGRMPATVVLLLTGHQWMRSKSADLVTTFIAVCVHFFNEFPEPQWLTKLPPWPGLASPWSSCWSPWPRSSPSPPPAPGTCSPYTGLASTHTGQRRGFPSSILSGDQHLSGPKLLVLSLINFFFKTHTSFDL